MTLDLNSRIMEKRKAAAAQQPSSTAVPVKASPTSEGRAKPVAGKGDRWAPLNYVADLALRDMTGAEAKVWLVLHREVRNGTVRVGMSDVARRAGISRRSVIRSIEAMKARGLLEVIARGTIDGNPNTYRLKAPIL